MLELDLSIGPGCPERFGISSLGDAQKLSGCGLCTPLQLALIEEGFEPDDPQKVLPTSYTL